MMLAGTGALSPHEAEAGPPPKSKDYGGMPMRNSLPCEGKHILVSGLLSNVLTCFLIQLEESKDQLFIRCDSYFPPLPLLLTLSFNSHVRCTSHEGAGCPGSCTNEPPGVFFRILWERAETHSQGMSLLETHYHLLTVHAPSVHHVVDTVRTRTYFLQRIR